MIVFCKCGQKIQSEIECVIRCPICNGVVRIGVLDGEPATIDLITGPELWAKLENPWIPLHKYGPDNKNNWVPSGAKRWYSKWLLTIPSYGCSCQQHWVELTAKLPPDFESARGFFEWSWKAHNEVSLNHSHKPTITLEEAYSLYW